MSYKHKIAKRAAQEIRPGEIINLGIGIPILGMRYLSRDMPVFIHSENGILGMDKTCSPGDEDRNLIDAEPFGPTIQTCQVGVLWFKVTIKGNRSMCRKPVPDPISLKRPFH